jgi:hypothetical protein
MFIPNVSPIAVHAAQKQMFDLLSISLQAGGRVFVTGNASAPPTTMFY